MDVWKHNATIVEREYGEFVDWEEEFYTCPECGEPIYRIDYTDEVLSTLLCPVCEFTNEFL